MSQSDLVNALLNVTVTENGAMAYASTLNACLDFFFKIVPRMRSNERLITLLDYAWQEDSTTALKLIFQLRDVRSGKNDRTNTVTCLAWLFEKHPKTFVVNMHLIPEVGCWKDLLDLLIFVMESRGFSNQIHLF
jgi:hypothetical protein